jgi:hypothetical protein
MIVMAREGGASSKRRRLKFYRDGTAYWTIRWSLSSGSPKARSGGG